MKVPVISCMVDLFWIFKVWTFRGMLVAPPSGRWAQKVSRGGLGLCWICVQSFFGVGKKGKGRYPGKKEKRKIEKNNTFIQIFFHPLAAICQIYCSGQLKSSLSEFFFLYRFPLNCPRLSKVNLLYIFEGACAVLWLFVPQCWRGSN